MKKIIEKSVNLNLIGVNGNAYAIMGAFRKQARKEGWSTEEIKAVIDEAISDDYRIYWQLLKIIENPKILNYEITRTKTSAHLFRNISRQVNGSRPGRFYSS